MEVGVTVAAGVPTEGKLGVDGVDEEVPAGFLNGLLANGFDPVPAKGFDPVPDKGFDPVPANGFDPVPAKGFDPVPAKGFTGCVAACWAVWALLIGLELLKSIFDLAGYKGCWASPPPVGLVLLNKLLTPVVVGCVPAGVLVDGLPVVEVVLLVALFVALFVVLLLNILKTVVADP